MASRVGAGMPIPDALNIKRWARELAVDYGCSESAAVQFTEAVSGKLTSAIGPLRDCASRVAATHVMYASLIEDECSTREGRTGKHMVYKLSDEDRQLLYIGITDRGPTRLAEHYRHKPWFHRVCHVEFERYESRAESEAREKYLIRKQAPLFNVIYNQGRQIA